MKNIILQTLLIALPLLLFGQGLVVNGANVKVKAMQEQQEQIASLQSALESQQQVIAALQEK